MASISSPRPIPSTSYSHSQCRTRFGSIGSSSSIAASSIARDLSQVWSPDPSSSINDHEDHANPAARWIRPRLSNPWSRRVSITSATVAEEEAHHGVSDQSPLLAGPTKLYASIGDAEQADQAWESTILPAHTQSRWQTEAKVLGNYSRSLTLTFLLQQSLTVASVFTVGHIGTVELGAVSLASMTANITGYAVYQGLATSLDTLAAQAYGSGRKDLVGLQTQRMLYFLWAITVPIAAIWACGTIILQAIVPDGETAALAGLYLKVLIAGAPGYAAFEAGKRFVQAQGLFSATLYCTLICAPLNAVMNYVFVWQFKWGFIGAPIAVSITQILLPLCLYGYVYLVDGRDCWNGLDRQALRNWWPMIQLAVPGLITMLAEFLAFEILTLAASRLGLTALAAQSVISTVTVITFQAPFAIGISASTRIANLIGAGIPATAKLAAKVDVVAATFVGILNIILLSSLRDYIPSLLTDDPLVSAAVSKAMPVCAAAQLFDSLATNCNGILRGLGRQEIGGYIGLVAFYVIALPISFWTGFGLQWGLQGLWAGPVVGLAVVALVEGWFICTTSWEKAVEEAKERNLFP